MSTSTTPLPKTMSSRLLTMKFMQRAAASSNTSPSPSLAQSTPDSSSPSPKRRKTDSKSSYTTTKFSVDALADQRAVQAAFEKEEAKRQAALERQANEAGDTRWVLSFEEQRAGAGGASLEEKSIRVVEMGFAGIDSAASSSKGFYLEDDEEEKRPVMAGRRSFGAFNKVVEKRKRPDDHEDDEEEDSKSGSTSSEDEQSLNIHPNGPNPNDPAAALILAERTASIARAKADLKAKRKAEKASSAQVAKERKKKEVNLNGLSSLSGRQEPARQGLSCYNCGGPHIKSECPQLAFGGYGSGSGKRRHEGGGDDGHKRKAMRSR